MVQKYSKAAEQRRLASEAWRSFWLFRQSQTDILSGGIAMEQDAAIRLLRVLIARGFRTDAPLADVALQNFAVEAGLTDEFNVAWGYALQQGWLVIAAAGWTKLSSAGYAAATA
jgi:hypothetical protein